jgi:N-acyl-D-amino-acid deacylase
MVSLPRTLFALAAVACAAHAQVTGQPVPELAVFDSIVPDVMSRHQVPGGALAVSYKGRLVYARGFGLSSREEGLAVQPEFLFRIASISKPITAAAVMRLVEEGRLELDKPAFGYLPQFVSPTRPPADPRVLDIRVRDLLQHSGGWDREATFDPMFQSVAIARAMGVPPPASCETTIRYMLGRRLDFTPGTKAVYSNFGYCVLGRIVEQASGKKYEDYVKAEVLQPIQVRGMVQGRTRLADKFRNEVRYYDHPTAGLAPSVFPDPPPAVPWPYGGFYLEAMDAHGAWAASAVDVLRMVNAFEGEQGSYLVSPESREQMLAKPPFYAAAEPIYYGLGWFVRPVGEARNWFHGGSMPGTETTVTRTFFDVSYVWLFNNRPRLRDSFVTELDTRIYRAAELITNWPSTDLYPRFTAPGGIPPIIDEAAGAVNGASFGPAVSHGAWISIRGINLAKTTRSWTAPDFVGDRLPLALDGVSVKINGRRAPVAYISPQQLNALAPAVETPGKFWFQVIVDGEPSRPVQFEMQTRAPEIFSYAAGGVSYAAAVHADGVLVGDPFVTQRSRAARPGDRLQLYATGLQPAPVDRILAEPVPLDVLPRILLGTQEASVEYAGTISPGLQQINFVVPNVFPGTPRVVVRIEGQASTAEVVIPVR